MVMGQNTQAAKRRRLQEEERDGRDVENESQDPEPAAGASQSCSRAQHPVAAYALREMSELLELVRTRPGLVCHTGDVSFLLDRMRSILAASSRIQHRRVRGHAAAPVPALPREICSHIFEHLCANVRIGKDALPRLQASTRALINVCHASKEFRALALPLALRAARLWLLAALAVRLGAFAEPLEHDAAEGRSLVLILKLLRERMSEHETLVVRWALPESFPLSGAPVLTYIASDVFEVREEVGEDGRPRCAYAQETMDVVPKRRLDWRGGAAWPAGRPPGPWRAAGYLANATVHYRAAFAKFLEAKRMVNSRPLIGPEGPVL
eukprot:tig00001694_g9570.t1